VGALAVVVADLHCKFLVPESGGGFRCSVYAERFERAPWCHTAEDALAKGLLSQTCGYVAGLPGYRGKVRLHPRIEAEALPRILEVVLRNGVPVGASTEGIARFLARCGAPHAHLALSADGERWEVRLHAPDSAEGYGS
jgi:hypothetical protein